MPVMPTDIVNEVEAVLRHAHRGKGERRNFLTAYQILERLPEPLRGRLIEERTIGGHGAGVAYAAPSVVSDAAERVPNVIIEYMDSVGICVQVAEQEIRPSNVVCGLYRVD